MTILHNGGFDTSLLVMQGTYLLSPFCLKKDGKPRKKQRWVRVYKRCFSENDQRVQLDGSCDTDDRPPASTDIRYISCTPKSREIEQYQVNQQNLCLNKDNR